MADTFRIFLAEDEPRILQFLEKKIHLLDPRFEIAGTARNGMDALSLIEELHPQALFSDVQMPVMNGLELISKVKASFPSIKTVIISGYRDFDYVREAMRHDVMDYLLKPILDQDLLKILHKLADELKDAAKEQEAEAIAAAVTNRLDLSSFPARSNKQSYCMVLISIGHLMNNSSQISHAKIFLNIWKKIDFCRILASCGIDPDDCFICDGWHINHKFLICKEECFDQVNSASAKLLEQIQDDSNGYPVNLCILPDTLFLHQLHQGVLTLQESIHQALIPGKSRILPVCNEKSDAAYPLALPEDQRHLLKSLISSGQIEETKKQLEKLLSIWISQQYPQISIEGGLRQLFRLFAATSFITDENELYLVEYNILAFLSTCRTPWELLPEVLEAAAHLLARQAAVKDYALKTVNDMEQYMRLHYTEDISLESIASLLGFHTVYLNRIFKKEKQITPIQFLINLRIEKAKELIAQNPALDFTTIGESVGYHDPHYFSRAFKKVTGLTPSEYRNLFGA